MLGLKGSGISPLAINSKGLFVVDSKKLRFSSLALFETKLYFQNEVDCKKAKSLLSTSY